MNMLYRPLMAVALMAAWSCGAAIAQEPETRAITFFSPLNLTVPAYAVGIFTGKPPAPVQSVSCTIAENKKLMSLMIIVHGEKPISVDVLVFEDDDLQFGDRIDNITTGLIECCILDGEVHASEHSANLKP